ncbi:stealth family protein [Actinomadura parmotrematis]|uniref:Stealth family protein n=1 Tax=Actinomadura parmotrematis TaxID=2864039 RepID=A0ABS7FT75_9ACTN|nr:stealth family protein [Actinomadura parmotrematis]MBW8483165.1 stealth family protein [Actinomadura parmotrematis]
MADRNLPQPPAPGLRGRLPAPVRSRLSAMVSPELRLRVENRLFQHRHRALIRERVLVTVDGRARVAEPRDDLSPQQVWRDTLGLVCAALSGAGVPFFCVRPVAPTESAVAVSADDRQRVIAALAAAIAAAGAYVGPLKDPDRSRAGMGDAAWAKVAARTGFRISRNFCTPDGTAVLGPEHCCVVEFWEPADGRLVAPRPNLVSPSLPAEGETVLVGGDRLTPLVGRGTEEPRYPTRPEFLIPLIDDIAFPIDAVYTWVDGGDPAWRARRDAARADAGGLHAHSANDARYISRDELRYSLRSLTAYAPWIRHVHLVTDAQVPPWLDVTHPQITVVDHKELFQDRGALPTFNSHAIESQLHHIDGLSEHFLYFNDDVFLGRLVDPTTFFAPNGTTRFFLSSALLDLPDPTADDQPAVAAGKNTRRLVKETFGTVPTRRIKHTPHALRRSILAEIAARYPEEAAATARHRFRHPADLAIPSSLYPYYSFLSGRAVEGDLSYRYIDLAGAEAADRLAVTLRDRGYDCFCVNDTESDQLGQSEQRALTERFMNAYFPVPSPFEIG